MEKVCLQDPSFFEFFMFTVCNVLEFNVLLSIEGDYILCQVYKGAVHGGCILQLGGGSRIVTLITANFVIKILLFLPCSKTS